jgi:hypothetical protein
VRAPVAFFSEAYAEQYRVQGGPEADAQATLVLDIPGVARVYEKNGYRQIFASERVCEVFLQIEAQLSRDDLRLLDKQHHVRILTLLMRIHTIAGLGQIGQRRELRGTWARRGRVDWNPAPSCQPGIHV